MNLPEPLENLIGGYTRRQATIGMSTAATYRLERAGHPALYLKIDRNNPRRELPTEKAVLSWLAGKLPVPEVLFFGEDDCTDYLLMSAIPGFNAVDIRGAIPDTGLVRLLARGLQIVHSVPVENCPFDCSLDTKIKMAKFNVSHNLVREDLFDEGRRDTSAAEFFKELGLRQRHEEDLVFTHGDYCLPNIVIDGDRVAGFIDLAGAGIADRYQDIALGLRSIRYNLGPGFEQIFLNEYGIARPDQEKIEYYRLLDELF
jgi:aminoglycoside phosphotransferase